MNRRDAIVASGLSLLSVPAAAKLPAARDLPPVRILSIDGGGIRGIAAAAIVAALDTAMVGSGHKAVRKTFDVFAGTSTGAIVAAGLAGAGTSPEGLVGLYRDRGPGIFKGAYWRALFDRLQRDPGDFLGQKYLSDGLQAVLEDELHDLKLKDMEKNFVAPFYSLGRVDGTGEPGAVIAVGGPDFTKAADPAISQLLVREVVLASASAPTFFNPAPVGNGQFLGVDGGIFANNPAAQALTLAQAAFGPDRRYELVSVGCGLKPLKYKGNKTWGRVEWLSVIHGLPLLEAVFDSQSSGTRQLVERVLGHDGAFRFDFDNRDDDSGMDDAGHEHISALLESAAAYVRGPSFAAERDRFLASLGPSTRVGSLR